MGRLSAPPRSDSRTDSRTGSLDPGPGELLVVGSTETLGNVGPVTVGLTAPPPDLALTIGQVAYLDTDEGRAVSPEAAVVGLAVVLGVVGATARASSSICTT